MWTKLKIRKNIICRNCKKEFLQSSPRQIYCGSSRKKTGCSYEISLINGKIRKRKRYYKNRILKPRKPRKPRKKDFIKEKYNRYRLGAKYRNIEFMITFEEFKDFWQKPCYYCGEEINKIGLDRINNKREYKVDNIVSCCSDCNYLKGRFTKDKFIEQCKKVAHNLL